MHASTRALLTISALSTALSAQTVVIPSTAGVGNGTNTQPWARTSATAANNDGRYQYTYDSTEVPVGGPVRITNIRFRAAHTLTTTTTWQGLNYTYVEVKLGTILDSLAMSTVFAANYLGGEPAPAYAGPVTVLPGMGNGNGIVGQWYVNIPLTTPVLYDPSWGDLLLDIACDGAWSGNGTSVASSLQSTARTRRIVNVDNYLDPTGSGPTNFSLIAELTYTPAVGTVANFGAARATAGPGEPIAFHQLAYSSAPGGITSFAWDFDGDLVTDSTAPSPTWSYGTCGPKNVSLTVTSASGSNTIQKPAVTIAVPISRFTATPATGQAPLLVNFTDTSLHAPVAWDWDLNGDGVFGDSTLQNPSFGYTTPDLVPVSLRTLNGCGPGTTATSHIRPSRSQCTIFNGVNFLTSTGSGGGWMFDLTVSNPAGVTIHGISGHADATPLTAEIWTAPSTYVGKEFVPPAWTNVSNGTGTGLGQLLESPINMSEVYLAPGSYGVLVWITTQTGRVYHGPTATAYPGPDLSISICNAHGTKWGATTFLGRAWNGCFYYSVGNQGAGAVAHLGAGCVNSSTGTARLTLQGGGVPRVGTTMTFEVGEAPASSPFAGIMLGFITLLPPTGGVDLSLIGARPGCVLYPNSAVTIPLTISALGTATANVNIGPNPSQAGLVFHAQGVFADFALVPPPSLPIVTGDAKTFTLGL